MDEHVRSAARLLLLTEDGRPIAHDVTDDEALASSSGRESRAMCGRVFRPAPLAAPIGARCPDCALLRPARPATHRSPAWWLFPFRTRGSR